MSKKAFLDFGHGGKDPGASGNGIKEKDIVLEVGLKVGEILKRHNVEVLYSRTTDVFIELTERSRMANDLGVDVFISIHCDNFSDKQANGLGTFYYLSSKNGMALAKIIQDSMLKENLHRKDRGIRAANFSVLRNTKMTSALVELAFISNKEDSEILKNKQDELAKGLARGILNFLGIKYIEETNKTENKIDKLYKVQVGAYSVKPNAEKLLKELDVKGFKGFIIEENIKVEEVKEIKTIYYEKEGLKIIETDSDNIYVSTLPGKTLREFGVYGINGTWQNNAEAHLARSIWGLVANSKGAIGPNSLQNSPKGHNRGTMICYEDGTIEVRRINNIDEITKPIQFAIGGGMLIPDYNPTLEGIANDILRHTHHTGIGYKGNRIYLIVTSSHCSLLEFRNKVEKLNLDGAVFLDGGGSTQMNYEGNKGIHSSRKLSHGIFIKGVK